MIFGAFLFSLEIILIYWPEQWMMYLDEFLHLASFVFDFVNVVAPVVNIVISQLRYGQELDFITCASVMVHIFITMVKFILINLSW